MGMTRNTWLRARVAMCEWFGGSTPRLVCDDLRTGVIRHPREGGIVLCLCSMFFRRCGHVVFRGVGGWFPA